MRGARFVFVSRIGEDRERISWLLMSRNNRQLGRSGQTFTTLDQCRDAAIVLCRDAARAKAFTLVGEAQWRWVWRVEIDGIVDATSARSYMRQWECDYNLERFLTALPNSELTTTVRTVRDNPNGLKR